MSYGRDNIISILKSIQPIKYKYSQKNRDLDKTFKTRSLENLLKGLDYKPKIFDEYAPDPEFLNRKYQFDINFQSSNEYIRELSDLNNLPIVMSNKNYLKNGTFNPDYEINPVKNKDEQKKILLEKERRKKERLQLRLDRLKKWRQSNNSVDPGKYHPNFDFVKRKIPSVYIREPIVKKEKKIDEKDKNENNTKKDNKNEDEDGEENNNNENETNSKIDDDGNKEMIEKEESNGNKNMTDSHSVNDNLSNNDSSKKAIIRKIHSNYERNINYRRNSKIYFEKNTSTVSDYNTFEGNKSTNIDEISSAHKGSDHCSSAKKNLNKNLFLPKIGTKKIKYIKPMKQKKNRFRSSSLANIKNPIIFKKMMGREDFLLGNNSVNLMSYFPDYESTMPHIPATIFKYHKNIQSFKKFITGKIIRGYNYSPEKYFVIEFQRSKNKNKLMNYEKRKENLRKKIE